eukprot:gene36420-44921_t
MCTPSSGMVTTCAPLLSAITNAVYGQSIDYSAYGISDPTTIQQSDALIAQAAVNCGDPSDQASVQILQYQSEVLCASSNNFGMQVSSAGNIDGIVDLRSMTQCGQCAVVPCQLCNGNGKAKMCPAGYYCPSTFFSIECPSGYFCPLGTVIPVKCDALAAGSCGKGSLRQVVWIPLLIAMLIVTLVAVCLTYMEETKDLMRWLVTKQSDETNFRKVSQVGGTSHLEEVHHHHALPKTAPVSITFDNITLVTGKTVRISGVSGHIRPGKFTAILGGSGAGKTSLMNVILGREDRTTGTVRYVSPNYKEGKQSIPCTLLDRIVAFVPQNDVYLREMTVYELVLHSAYCRLPISLTREQKLQRVEDVLTQLELQAIRDVTVGALGGSAGGSSLSPGDRKMVNIALELVAGPNILFLDEPTTGIDSSS